MTQPTKPTIRKCPTCGRRAVYTVSHYIAPKAAAGDWCEWFRHNARSPFFNDPDAEKRGTANHAVYHQKEAL